MGKSAFDSHTGEKRTRVYLSPTHPAPSLFMLPSLQRSVSLFPTQVSDNGCFALFAVDGEHEQAVCGGASDRPPGARNVVHRTAGNTQGEEENSCEFQCTFSTCPVCIHQMKLVCTNLPWIKHRGWGSIFSCNCLTWCGCRTPGGLGPVDQGDMDMRHQTQDQPTLTWSELVLMGGGGE